MFNFPLANLWSIQGARPAVVEVAGGQGRGKTLMALALLKASQVEPNAISVASMDTAMDRRVKIFGMEERRSLVRCVSPEDAKTSAVFWDVNGPPEANPERAVERIERLVRRARKDGNTLVATNLLREDLNPSVGRMPPDFRKHADLVIHAIGAEVRQVEDMEAAKDYLTGRIRFRILKVFDQASDEDLMLDLFTLQVSPPDLVVSA